MFLWRLSPKILFKVFLRAEHVVESNYSARYYCKCRSGVGYCCLRKFESNFDVEC